MLNLRRIIAKLIFLVFVIMGVFACVLYFLQLPIQDTSATAYSFSDYYHSLTPETQHTIEFCDLPLNTANDVIDHCANTGKLPTALQADLWSVYPVWVLCHKYNQSYACKQLVQ